MEQKIKNDLNKILRYYQRVPSKCSTVNDLLEDVHAIIQRIDSSYKSSTASPNKRPHFEI